MPRSAHGEDIVHAFMKILDTCTGEVEGSNPFARVISKTTAPKGCCFTLRASARSVAPRGFEEVEYIARRLCRARYETCTVPVRKKSLRSRSQKPSDLFRWFLYYDERGSELLRFRKGFEDLEHDFEDLCSEKARKVH